MAKRVVKLILAGVLVVGFVFAPGPHGAWAQNPPGVETNAERTELTGTRKQMATIIFAGLAGAILGLSTLSFYGRPQEHLSNIAVGFAVGVIGGAIYTTYKTATRPYEVYDFSFNQLEHKQLQGMDVYGDITKNSSQQHRLGMNVLHFEF